MADLGTMTATLGVTTRGIQAAQKTMLNMLNQINARLNETNAKLNSIGTKAGAQIAPGMQKVTAAIVPAQASLEKFTSTLAMNSQRLRTFGYLATSTVTVPLTVMGGAALNTAKDFDFALAKIRGLVGASASEVEGLKEKILELSPTIGQTPLKLAESLYYTMSAGFKDSGEAMKIVETAAKATRAGLGETEDIAKLLVFSINAYKDEGLTAARVADVFTAAVREGAIEAEGFATAMQSVLPIASALGVGIDQVAGAMAAMSLQGASAANAATYLRGIMNSLLKIKPGSGAWKALEELGVPADSLMEKLKRPNGLMDTLMELKELSNKSAGNVFLKQIFRDVRAMTGALSLTGQNAEAVQKILDEVSGAYGDLGRAGAEVTNEIQTKMDQIKATTSKAMSVLGEGLSKTLLPLFESLVQKLTNATEWFSQLNDSQQRLVTTIGLVAAALGPLTLLFSFFGYLVTGLLNALPILTRLFAGLSVVAPWVLITTAVVAGTAALIKYKKKVEEAATASSSLNTALVNVNGELKKLTDLSQTDLSGMTGTQIWEARSAANKAYQEARRQALDFAKKGGLTEEEFFSGVRPHDKMGIFERMFGTDYTKIMDLWLKKAIEAKDQFEKLDEAFTNWSNNFGKSSGSLLENTDDLEDNINAIEKQESAIQKLLEQYKAETKYLNLMKEISQGGARFDFDFDTAKLDLAESTLKDFIKEVSKIGSPAGLVALGGPISLIGTSLEAVMAGLIKQVNDYKKAIEERTNAEQLRLLKMEADAFGGIAGKIEVVNYELQAATKQLKDLFKSRLQGAIVPDSAIKAAVEDIRKYRMALVDLENASDMQFLNDMWKSTESIDNATALLSGHISQLEKKLRSLSEAGEGGSVTFNRLSSELQNLRRGQEIGDMLNTSFNTLFDSLIDGTKDWGQVFEEIGKTILKTIAEMITRLIITKAIMTALFPGSGAISSVSTGNISLPTFGSLPGLSGPPTFAKGGIVPPGYPNDTYPALLTSGERVIPALESSSIRNGGFQTQHIKIEVDGQIDGKNIRLALRRNE